MNDPIFVSFCTPDYEPCAGRLLESLGEHGLEGHIVRLPSKGRWDLNARRKPAFIREMIDLHRGRPVVWTDADSVVRRRPDLFWTTKADVAVMRFTWPGSGLRECITGTVYFSGSDASREFASRWEALCAATSERVGDQALFNQLMEREKPRAAVEFLPVSYNFIYDKHRALFPDMEPVVEHFQASRTFKSAKA